MEKYTETTLRLVKLDRAGVSVWRNKAGWWWATLTGLQDAVKANAPSPARGPFASALEAGRDATERLQIA